MASVTRSTRRAEGLHPHHNNVSGPFTRSGSESLFNAASARGPGGVGGGRTNKRSIALEATTERDFRSAKHKKARISVEIISKHPPSPESPEPASKPRSPPSPTVTIAKPVSAVAAEQGHDAPGSQQPRQPADPNNLTKHQAKVVNGIKHELQRLQPAGPAAESPSKSQGRKLRSRDVTRFKSELSAYFPEYDEVIGNEPKEECMFAYFSIVQTSLRLCLVQVLIDFRSVQRRYAHCHSRHCHCTRLGLCARNTGATLPFGFHGGVSRARIWRRPLHKRV